MSRTSQVTFSLMTNIVRKALVLLYVRPGSVSGMLTLQLLSCDDTGTHGISESPNEMGQLLFIFAIVDHFVNNTMIQSSRDSLRTSEWSLSVKVWLRHELLPLDPADVYPRL